MNHTKIEKCLLLLKFTELKPDYDMHFEKDLLKNVIVATE